MLKRKPVNQYHHILPYYIGEYEPKQNNVAFKSAKEVLIEADKNMFEKRHFERINNAIKSIADTKYEDNPENKEIFTYGLKHIKTDKFYNYKLFGHESHEL